MVKINLFLFIFILVKLNFLFGQSEWESKITVFGGSNIYIKHIEDFKEGFIITGSCEASGGSAPEDQFSFMAKFDSVGNPQWCRANEPEFTTGTDLFVKTYNDSIIITWGAYNFGGITKWNSTGQIIWSKRYFSQIPFTMTDLTMAREGGFIYTGFSFAIPGFLYNGLIIKTDSSGTVLWSKRFFNNYKIYDLKVYEMPNKNLLLTGILKDSASLKYEYFLMNTDSFGEILFSYKYDDVDSTDFLNSAYDNDSFIYVINRPIHYMNKLNICKINTYTGIPVWENETEINYRTNSTLVVSNDSLFIPVDSSGKSSILIFDTSGVIRDVRETNSMNGVNSISVNTSNFLLSGVNIISLSKNDIGNCSHNSTLPQSSYKNLMVDTLTFIDSTFFISDSAITFSPLNPSVTKNVICTSVIGVETISSINLFTLTPVPVVTNLQIESNSKMKFNSLLITDITGRILKKVTVDCDNYSLPMTDLSPGFYIILLLADDQILYRKVLQKI